MESLDGAKGAVLAGDDHHIGMQVVLDFQSLEQDSLADGYVQGRMQALGSRDPCKRGKFVSVEGKVRKRTTQRERKRQPCAVIESARGLGRGPGEGQGW
jgi:hypothetical protein